MAAAIDRAEARSRSPRLRDLRLLIVHIPWKGDIMVYVDASDTIAEVKGKIIHKTLNRRQRRRLWRRGIDPGRGVLLVGHPTEHMAVVEAHDDQTVLELRMDPGLLLIWMPCQSFVVTHVRRLVNGFNGAEGADARMLADSIRRGGLRPGARRPGFRPGGAIRAAFDALLDADHG